MKVNFCSVRWVYKKILLQVTLIHVNLVFDIFFSSNVSIKENVVKGSKRQRIEVERETSHNLKACRQMLDSVSYKNSRKRSGDFDRTGSITRKNLSQWTLFRMIAGMKFSENRTSVRYEREAIKVSEEADGLNKAGAKL